MKIESGDFILMTSCSTSLSGNDAPLFLP